MDLVKVFEIMFLYAIFIILGIELLKLARKTALNGGNNAN
jgi:hypothetical protein